MPMIEGLIVIDPVTGTVTTSTGAAGVVFDEMNSLQDYGAVTGPDLAAARERIADIARSTAKMITYIQTNAVVTTTVTTTGLATGVTVGPGTAPTTGAGSGTGTIA